MPFPLAGPVANTALVPMASVPINVAGISAGTSLVAPVANQSVYVYGYNFQVAGATNVTFGSYVVIGTITALTGPYPEAPNTGLSVAVGVYPIFVCPVGTGLAVINSAAFQLSGVVAYAQY